MNLRFRLGLFLLILALGLAGCISSGSGTGSSVVRSVARIGDTAAVVQQKMGDPDKKQKLADGQSVWTYDNFIQRSGGPQATGWSEVLVPETVSQGETVEKQVTREVYRAEGKEDIRITFKGGVVSAVESVAQP